MFHGQAKGLFVCFVSFSVVAEGWMPVCVLYYTRRPSPSTPFLKVLGSLLVSRASQQVRLVQRGEEGVVVNQGQQGLLELLLV